ncbi:GNAT family N-acetyltransferase [Roseateles albus]|uniref:GNAT family N-acetyltransferase n=1 Tax=Roseateles albus TaxID=2987525 RepID=A0ABT5KB54_9BURK|nr:GNAT family N-acetyltransferase [Roseateles albus]MDC8770669.1 GNAT family N-acetyltransferase [Roseateles albus]
MSAVPLQLHTERLLLRAASAALAPAVNGFQMRNLAHFAPWDPPYAADYFEPEGVSARLDKAEQDFAAGSAFGFWFSRLDAPADLIGKVNVTQVSRGPFQSASLGYAIDAQAQGQGLMHEALQAVIALMFAPPVRLHRLQAAVRPENRASLAVMKRLGFAHEGLSRRYLFIAGAWRDHETFALINPDWGLDESP